MSEAARSVARPSRATGQTRDHERAYLAPFRKGHVCARTDSRMIGLFPKACLLQRRRMPLPLGHWNLLPSSGAGFQHGAGGVSSMPSSTRTAWSASRRLSPMRRIADGCGDVRTSSRAGRSPGAGGSWGATPHPSGSRPVSPSASRRRSGRALSPLLCGPAATCSPWSIMTPAGFLAAPEREASSFGRCAWPDVLALAGRGDLGGMSFSFNAMDEHCTGDRRELRAIELHEVSIVLAWPGCEGAVITALACIRLIAETLAAMPLEPHRFSEGGDRARHAPCSLSGAPRRDAARPDLLRRARMEDRQPSDPRQRVRPDRLERPRAGRCASSSSVRHGIRPPSAFAIRPRLRDHP